MDYIRQIEQTNRRQMRALRPPHRKEVLKAREDEIKSKVQNWMEADKEPRVENIAKQLLETYDQTELVTALLQELVESNDEVEVQLTFEKPLARKNRSPKGNRKVGNNKRHSKSNRNFKQNNNNKKGNFKHKRETKVKKGRTFADHQK